MAQLVICKLDHNLVIDVSMIRSPLLRIYKSIDWYFIFETISIVNQQRNLVSALIPRYSPSYSQARAVNVFSVFSESIKRQIDENKEFQENVKQLGEQSTKIAESDAVTRAREAVTKTSETTSKVMNAVGAVVDKTLDTPVVKMTGQAIAKTVEGVAYVSQKAAEPIANTTAAKAISSGIKEVVESSSNAFYTEYKPKEVREKEKQERLDSYRKRNPLSVVQDPSRPVLADPEAGSNVVMHKSSEMTEAWRKFLEESTLGRTLFAARRSVEQSESPLMSRVRNFLASTKVEESEHARTIRAFKQVEPTFSVDAFLKETTQYTIPELMEAFLKGDADTLKEWCSEAALAKLTAGFESQKQQGLVSDSKLLDIRGVDIRQLKLLNDEVPIILIGFTTQEILLFRNRKGEIVVGSEDVILTASYAIAFTKAQLVDSEVEYNPATNGWLVVDYARHSSGW
ncbi:protein translocase subunit [Batrachochytrium dendrobatidis]|nr:protein translocase subunit [Batrachochytrium dendrobatidis]